MRIRKSDKLKRIIALLLFIATTLKLLSVFSYTIVQISGVIGGTFLGFMGFRWQKYRETRGCKTRFVTKATFNASGQPVVSLFFTQRHLLDTFHRYQCGQPVVSLFESQKGKETQPVDQLCLFCQKAKNENLEKRHSRSTSCVAFGQPVVSLFPPLIYKRFIKVGVFKKHTVYARVGRSSTTENKTPHLRRGQTANAGRPQDLTSVNSIASLRLAFLISEVGQSSRLHGQCKLASSFSILVCRSSGKRLKTSSRVSNLIMLSSVH